MAPNLPERTYKSQIAICVSQGLLKLYNISLRYDSKNSCLVRHKGVLRRADASICIQKCTSSNDLTIFRNTPAPLEANDLLDNNVAELRAAFTAIRITNLILGKLFSTPLFVSSLKLLFCAVT